MKTLYPVISIEVKVITWIKKWGKFWMKVLGLMYFDGEVREVKSNDKNGLIKH